MRRSKVARNVSTVRVLGDHLMRFGVDWNTNQTILDMTPVARATEAQPEAEIDLAALFGEDAWSCAGGSNWSGQVFTRGNYAYVPRYTYSYDQNTGSNYQQRLTFYIVDLSDRSAPRAVGSFLVAPAANETYYTNVIQTDDALLVGRTRGYYSYSPDGEQTSAPRYFYDVIDLADPAADAAAGVNMPKPAQVSRRLVSAACAIDHCLVYYERVGASQWNAALLHWTPENTRVEWGAAVPGGIASIDEVKLGMLSGAFKTPLALW